MVNAGNHFEPKRQAIHTMSRHTGPGLTVRRKSPLGLASAMAIAIPLALGTAGCASKGGAHRAEASNGRQPWFNTTSIKLNDEPRARGTFTFSKNRFVARESAIDLIMFTYGDQQGPLKPLQVLGGPDWARTALFNIDAELPKSLSDQVRPPLQGGGPPLLYPDGVRRTDAIKQVFRSLLINRFKLRVRRETKVLPVYELVLANNAPKIIKDKTGNGSCQINDVAPDLPSVFVRKGLWLDVRSCDFNAFGGFLSAEPELRSRVLVDKTGLHGRYSFRLHYSPKRPPEMRKAAGRGQINRSAAPADSSGPSLFTALREQLGLKLVSGQTPVDVVVIEHIEQPTPN